MPLDRPRRPLSTDAALDEVKRRAAGLRRRRHRRIGGGAAAAAAAVIAVVLAFALPSRTPTSVNVTGPTPAPVAVSTTNVPRATNPAHRVTGVPSTTVPPTTVPARKVGAPPITSSGPGPGPTTTTTTTPPTTTTPSTTTMVTRAVPLVSCPTTFGAPPPHPTHQPSTATVTVPPPLADHVAVYTDTQGRMQIVAPRGWRCTADYGADSSGGVVAYPAGETVPANWGAGWHLAAGAGTEAVVGTETSACTSCTTGQACPLFTAAAQAFRRQLGRPCPTTRPRTESVSSVGSGLVIFEDPPGVAGDGLPSGGADPANGVMTYHSPSGDGSWLETCTLPSAETGVCTVSLNRWLADYGSR
ncbi:MAG TPA: hypothetical protein VKV06_14665 [Acidimicrobiales bacterium]|nr:hypothetical protein [Acidimicrobiales bacterium]